MAHYSSFDPTVWQRNLKALGDRDPELVRRLTDVSLSDRYVIAQTADGWPVVGMAMENGRTEALCHPEHPRQEAEQWVLGMGEGARKNAHILLLGFGVGYHPLALFRLMDRDSLFWMVEPDLALMKLALHVMDLVSLIESPRVRFAVGLPENEVARLLFTGPGAHRMRAEGIRMVFTGISRHLYSEYIQHLGEAIQEAIQMEGLKFKTSEIQGETILKNVLSNIPYILEGAPWKRLIGSASGIPALVIAPGPSLEEALPYLAAVRDRALFIAIDTAHRILHRHGIVSDLVVSIDFTELNVRHFDSIQNDDAILLAFPGVDSAIPSRYRGRTFFYDHSGSVDFGPGATAVLKSLTSLERLGDLVSFGSTAHIALHAARMMGGSPIILIGNDLAFPDARWYADGAMQNEIDQPERKTEPMLSVPANDGQIVLTSGLYKYYLDTFGELIRGSAASVINTSPRGARIEGAKWMDLQETLSRYCTDPVDVSFMQRSLNPTLATRRRALMDQLHRLSESCRRGRRRLHRLSGQLESVSPTASTFPQEMMRLMKSFTAFLIEEQSVIALCTALCSRSTIAFLGGSGQSNWLGGIDPQINQQVQERCCQLFDDLEKALRVNGKSMGEAAKNLSTIHFTNT